MLSPQEDIPIVNVFSIISVNATISERAGLPCLPLLIESWILTNPSTVIWKSPKISFIDFSIQPSTIEETKLLSLYVNNELWGGTEETLMSSTSLISIPDLFTNPSVYVGSGKKWTPL